MFLIWILADEPGLASACRKVTPAIFPAKPELTVAPAWTRSISLLLITAIDPVNDSFFCVPYPITITSSKDRLSTFKEMSTWVLFPTRIS